jgi:hypothetical protein
LPDKDVLRKCENVANNNSNSFANFGAREFSHLKNLEDFDPCEIVLTLVHSDFKKEFDHSVFIQVLFQQRNDPILLRMFEIARLMSLLRFEMIDQVCDGIHFFPQQVVFFHWPVNLLLSHSSWLSYHHIPSINSLVTSGTTTP